MQGVRKPNFFLSHFLSRDERVKHSKVHNTTQNSPPSFPVIFLSAWTDEVQLFLQVNTPIFVDNEAGREGRLLNMGADCGWVLGEAGRIPLLLLLTQSHCHSNMSQKLD